MITDAVLALLVIIGVSYDLKERCIPNWVTMPGLAAGLIIQTVYGGASGFASALSGATAGALLLALPYALGWVGGGDLKLLAAVGALMGVPFAFWALVFASAVGGILALGWLAVTGSLASSLSYMFLVWLPMPRTKPAALATPLSFGPALALGVAIARFWR